MPALDRRATATVRVGGVPVGSRHPIVVQSMTNTDTADVRATVAQVAPIIPYLLLVLILMFRPKGLLGDRDT